MVYFCYFYQVGFYIYNGATLKVCLDLEKLEGKQKILESSFLSIIWLEESQKEKNREETYKKNLSCYEEKIFLPNMGEKWRKNLFLIVYKKINKLM